MVSKNSQSAKALSPISTTVSGMTTLRIYRHPAKQPAEMEVRSFPSSTLGRIMSIRSSSSTITLPYSSTQRGFSRTRSAMRSSGISASSAEESVCSCFSGSASLFSSASGVFSGSDTAASGASAVSSSAASVTTVVSTSLFASASFAAAVPADEDSSMTANSTHRIRFSFITLCSFLNIFVFPWAGA